MIRSPTAWSGSKPRAAGRPARPARLDFRRLVDALCIAEGGFIGFALYSTPGAGDRLMRAVRSRLTGRRAIRRVRLTTAAPCLPERLTLLASGGPAAAPSAYFVTGLERVSEAARRQAYGALQIKREALGRLQVPIIFWVTEAGLCDLARRAPDFFAWRGGLYDLRGDRPAVPASRKTKARRPRARLGKPPD